MLKTFSDITKIKKEYNFKPKIRLKEGLKNYIKWFKVFIKLIQNKIIKISKKAFFTSRKPTLVSKNNLTWIDIYEKKLFILNLINKKLNKKIKIFKQRSKIRWNVL